MRRIANQLADLFARHGLTAEVDAAVTGRTRTTYRFPLVLRGGPTVLLDGDLENGTVDDGSVLRLYLAATDVGGKALFVHSGAVPASAREYCGDRVTLWSKADIIAAFGLTAWNSALGLPLPRLPYAGAHQAEAPLASAPAPAPAPAQATLDEETPSAPPVPPTPPASMASLIPTVAELSAMLDPVEATPATESPADAFIDLGEARPAPVMDLETGDEVQVTTLPKTAADELATAVRLPVPEPELATHPAPTTLKEVLPAAFQANPKAPAPPVATAAAAPALGLPPAFRPATGDAVPLPVPEGSNGLLPARVTVEEAQRAVSGRLFGIEEWELILQPVHLFDYAVDLLRDGSLNMDTERGRVQVNGTDRRVTTTDPAASDPPARVFATPGLVVMDKVLRVSPERAEQVARAWATERHGKTVHVPLSGADDGFDLTERRTVGPTSGQVTLQPLGVWHRPFWRLWGSNGHVDLDAVEGMVLDEEIKAADPDCLVVE